MKIERFYDMNLAHASYIILSNKEIALIDPARNTQPYYQYAVAHGAKITTVIETHPHADFVSSHLEIKKQTNANIYVSKMVGASYPHTSFDDGDEIQLGELTLKAINTPGHSPDSISVLLLDEKGEEQAIFTGDTLFIGDVGRPDLRENVGTMTAKREALAKQMYHTIQNKYTGLKDETVVYPAHGAGSLCGKNLSSDASSTLGKERKENWAFNVNSEAEFVETILEDQPFVPKYFGYDVDMNKEGAVGFENGTHGVEKLTEVSEIPSAAIIVDVRDHKAFKKKHWPNSINIMLTEHGKFETWLGAIIDPSEEFYIIADTGEQRDKAIDRAAKIGYEKLILGALSVNNQYLPNINETLDLKKFTNNEGDFSIVDVRNVGEVKDGKYFKNAIAIPLYELRERVNEIPQDKPIVVHCASGYRSAVGSSIIKNKLNNIAVYDLGEDIDQFK